MTYPPPPHQPYGQPTSPGPGYPPYGPPPVVNVNPAQPDASRRFLNLSGAALIWLIIGAIVVCVGGPVALCLFCSVGGLLSGVDPTTSPSGF